jgi:hypothetical protein
MKINYWKAAMVSLVCVLLWLVYSGRRASAQYSLSTRITKLTGAELMDGPVNVRGEVKGFSCVAEEGSEVKCYVLTK